MPIQKFKTFQQAEEALWVMRPDENYYQKVSEHWEFANKVHPRFFPRGVFKFKTMTEANTHREAIDLKVALEIYKERFENKIVVNK